jgi:hypothetical protein
VQTVDLGSKILCGEGLRGSELFSTLGCMEMTALTQFRAPTASECQICSLTSTISPM